MSQTTHGGERHDTPSSPSSDVAVVTSDRPGERPGTHRIITRLGKTVVVHDRLTEADRRALLADPTHAHRREWAVVLTRTGARNR